MFTVNWAPPFQRVYMIPELEKQLGVKFPPPSDFHSPGRPSPVSTTQQQTFRLSHVSTADIPSLSCLNGRHTVSLTSLAAFTKFLDDLCVQHSVDCSPPRTAPRLLDKASINLASFPGPKRRRKGLGTRQASTLLHYTRVFNCLLSLCTACWRLH